MDQPWEVPTWLVFALACVFAAVAVFCAWQIGRGWPDDLRHADDQLGEGNVR